MVLDTCSGSVHVVDEVAYDMIALYPSVEKEAIIEKMLQTYGHREDVTREDLELCMQDIQALVDGKKLYTPDTYEPLAGNFKAKSGNVVKALCLHV